jgi:hypothetical protein
MGGLRGEGWQGEKMEARKNRKKNRKTAAILGL